MCPLPTADHGPVCVSEASSFGLASARRHVTRRVSECLTLCQERREALIRHGLTRRRHIQNCEKSNWSRCKEDVDPKMTTLKIHFRIPNMPRGPCVYRTDHDFLVLVLHNYGKVGPQTSKHSRKGPDVFCMFERFVHLTSRKLPSGFIVIKPKTKSHVISWAKFSLGFRSLYSTDELSCG